MDSELQRKELAEELEENLLQLYGSPVIAGDDLQKAMGYRSRDALRQAILRKTIPVRVFKIEKRRGQFALVKDIATWLAKQRIPEIKEKGGGKEN